MAEPELRVRVGHVDEAGWDVYIGNVHETRGLAESPWHCPFTVDDARGSRELMLAQYRVYVLERLELVRQQPTLRGLKLACWCHREQPVSSSAGYGVGDIACHGDVLAELAEALPPNTVAWLDKP